MSNPAGQPQLLPWMLGALAATMGVLALISVMVVAAESDRALFAASVEPISMRWGAMVAMLSILVGAKNGLEYFLDRSSAISTMVFVVPIVGLIGVNAYRLWDMGHCIVEQDGKLYVTAGRNQETTGWTAVEWKGQVPSLSHVSRKLFAEGAVTLKPHGAVVRAELGYTPARSTTLACYYFMMVGSVICWLAALGVGVYRVVRPERSCGLLFLTACPAVWTALMVATLYLLK